MKVTVTAYTEKPISHISKCAGVSFNKTNESRLRLYNCIKNRHYSVLEHAQISWFAEGVSRSLTHQLVRHRLASYTEMSQRYVKLKYDEIADWFTTPKSIKEKGFESYYKNQCLENMKLYQTMLEGGVPAEDARYILPNSTHSKIAISMNLREFLCAFYPLRSDSHAQWEIRELAEKMLNELEGINEEYSSLIAGWKDIKEAEVEND